MYLLFLAEKEVWACTAVYPDNIAVVTRIATSNREAVRRRGFGWVLDIAVLMLWTRLAIAGCIESIP